MTRVQRAERAALELLRTAKVTRPPVDVEELTKGQGVRLDYRVLEDDVSGCLIRDKHGRILMAVNQRHHPNRQRFTIAHELGHLLLHGSEPTLFVDNMMVHFRAGSASTDPKEIEANIFAGTLLLPLTMLQQDLQKAPLDPFDEESVLRLSRRYGVSQQALTIQLVRHGLVEGLSPPAKG